MAQQYFKSHTGVDPKFVARSGKLIDKAYKKLISFECKEGGFEWFGQGKGHESLTAYGVLQFTDMAKVYDVDQVMLDRNIAWLKARRDPDGGFKVNPKFLHSWGCPKHLSDAYIVWSLIEAGDKTLGAEVEALAKQAGERDDPYFSGLVAASLFNIGSRDAAEKLLLRIAKHQRDDGSVLDSKTTVVCSRGDALRIETTSVAVLAWLKDDNYAGNVEKGIEWLVSRCKNGRFGSTQSTVLALKAIIAYDESRATPKAAGEALLLVDGQIHSTVKFTKEATGTIILPDFSELLEPGEHTVELRMRDGSKMPYSLDIEFYATKPDNDPECELGIQTALAATEVREGETIEINVIVTNLDKKNGQTMAIARIGLPGGLEPRHEQLKELVKSGTINAYEIIGREVVCYFTQMEPGQVSKFRIDTIAAVPGEYTGPASRAYLYYVDEYQHWVDGLRLKITKR